jgi:5-methylcytosine-specific restriction enzyme subunit McrC
LAVDRWTRSPENQRRARTLRFLLTDIPESRNHRRNFQFWSTDRALIDYRGLKPWCELILNEQSPLFLAGPFSGLSFLFPMEQLFERYVASVLQRKLPPDHRLIGQPSRHSLVTHRGSPWFRLKPDLLIERPDHSIAAVLDTKWKRVDENLYTPKDKYGLKQADFYQMAAYGQRYLAGSGDMFLIFPSSPSFRHHLEPFELSEDLRLWVLPFDLKADVLDFPNRLVGLDQL